MKLLAGGRIHEVHRIPAVTRRELFAPGVRRRRDLDDRRTYFELRPGWHIVLAEIEIHEKLVASQGPTGLILSEESDDARVHHCDLRIRIGRALRRARIAARFPIVPQQTLGWMQFTFLEYFALFLARSAHD